MQIDQIDLKIIRTIEDGNRPFFATIARHLRIEKEEVEAKLLRLEKERLIRSYKTTINIPLIGGDEWILGCLLGIASNPNKAVKSAIQKLEFVTDVFYNLSFPNSIGPNLNILFYTQDFLNSVRILKEIKDFEYVEIHKLREYSFPMPTILSSAEQELLREIYTNPLASPQELANSCNQRIEWIEEKMNRLLTNSSLNSDFQGIAKVLPELDWRVCENFSHIHFLILKGTESNLPKAATQEVPVLQPIFNSRPFADRFYQFEADVWGINDFSAKIKILKESGAEVKGFILAESNEVINNWIHRYL